MTQFVKEKYQKNAVPLQRDSESHLCSVIQNHTAKMLTLGIT